MSQQTERETGIDLSRTSPIQALATYAGLAAEWIEGRLDDWREQVESATGRSFAPSCESIASWVRQAANELGGLAADQETAFARGEIQEPTRRATAFDFERSLPREGERLRFGVRRAIHALRRTIRINAESFVAANPDWQPQVARRIDDVEHSLRWALAEVDDLVAELVMINAAAPTATWPDVHAA